MGSQDGSKMDPEAQKARRGRANRCVHVLACAEPLDVESDCIDGVCGHVRGSESD